MISAYYMFIETNPPRQQQDNAYLRTGAQYTNDGRARCLHLWYNAYGTGIGTLRISTGDINGFNKNQLAEIPSRFLLFPDKEKTGIFVVTQGKFLSQGKYFWQYFCWKHISFNIF